MRILDATLGILILVAIIYLLIFIGAIVFIVNKKRGTFKQTVDPKPGQYVNEKDENQKR